MPGEDELGFEPFTEEIEVVEVAAAEVKQERVHPHTRAWRPAKLHFPNGEGRIVVDPGAHRSTPLKHEAAGENRESRAPPHDPPAQGVACSNSQTA
jgi:hypothetical protein